MNNPSTWHIERYPPNTYTYIKLLLLSVKRNLVNCGLQSQSETSLVYRTKGSPEISSTMYLPKWLFPWGQPSSYSLSWLPHILWTKLLPTATKVYGWQSTQAIFWIFLLGAILESYTCPCHTMLLCILTNAQFSKSANLFVYSHFHSRHTPTSKLSLSVMKISNICGIHPFLSVSP